MDYAHLDDFKGVDDNEPKYDEEDVFRELKCAIDEYLKVKDKII